MIKYEEWKDKRKTSSKWMYAMCREISFPAYKDVP